MSYLLCLNEYLLVFVGLYNNIIVIPNQGYTSVPCAGARGAAIFCNSLIFILVRGAAKYLHFK